jgi:hypothetical protein
MRIIRRLGAESAAGKYVMHPKITKSMSPEQKCGLTKSPGSALVRMRL